jgi:hypothetical protein
MAQQIINTGAVANDGTGDPLRTAFTETNDNFTEIYTAGPVGSNIRIANNTILTLNTNGNLVLAPNGIGVVQSNVNIVPNQANVRNLGSSTQRWGTVYAKYVDITNGTIYSGDLTVSGNLSAATVTTPELTVNTIRSDDSTVVNIQDGVEVDGDILVNGNVTADYVLGDGSQLLNIPVGNNGAVQVAWLGKFSNQGGTPDDTYSTLQFDSDGMPTLDGTSAYQQRVDYSPYLQVLAPEVESTDFDIVAGPGITVVGYDDNYNTPRSAYLSVQDQATATQQWDFGILGNGSNNFSIQDRTGNQTWSFGTDGNINIPGLAFNINYANSESATLSPSVGNSGAVQVNWQGSLSNQGGTPGDTYSTMQFDSDGLLNVNGTTAYQPRVDYTPYVTVNTPRVESTDFDIVAGPGITVVGYDDNYNIPRSAYMSVQDQATATQQWDFGILGNGSNAFSVRNRTASTIPLAISTDGTVTASTIVTNSISSDDSSFVTIQDGLNVVGDIETGGNVTADYFIGDGSQLTGLPASYNNSNVTTLLSNLGSNVISGTGNITTTANISGAFIKGNGSELTNLPAPTVAQDITSTGDMSIMTYDGNLKYVNYATVEPATGNIKTSGNISATGNITAANLGNIVAINLDGNVGNVLSGTGTWIAAGSGSTYGNANVATFLAAFGSNAISTTGNVTASNFVGNISITGNVVGTQPNVTLVAGSYSTVFDNTGNLTLPGNTFSVNYANNTPVPVVTRVESSWTVPVGNSTQSFTVPINNTYQLWVNSNIPNGIIVWNATVSVSNTNVPVIGYQYAWNYEGGGNILMLTSIPDQIIGTAGAISNAQPAVANTNVFSFGINNTSGNAVTVNYGWIQIS